MTKKPSAGDQIVSGLRQAGLVILACVTGTLFVWGSLVVSHEAAGSVFVGWAALAAALLILVFNLNGWARMLPGLLALASVNALVMAASGHMLNRPSLQVSRGMALGSAAALAVAAVVSAQFHGKRLSLLDRVVLVAYVGFILLGLVSHWVLVSFSLGTLVLAVPWLDSRIRGSRSRT